MRYGGAIEADLQHHYNVDIRWLVDGRLTWRRLAVLLRHLPADSVVGAKVHGDAVAWTTSEHLLATVVDCLQIANWQRSGGKSKRPELIERPGAKPRRDRKQYGGARKFKPAEIDALFGGREPRAPEAPDTPEAGER